MSAAHQINVAPIVYREFQAGDEGFVYNSWLKSFRSGSSWFPEVPAKIYFANHKLIISRLLAESGVVIAANPESTDQIFGYGVYQPTSGGVTILHYVYVKHPYRRLGIGGDIVRMIQRISEHDTSLPMVATHAAANWDSLRDKWQLLYNPYVIIGARE